MNRALIKGGERTHFTHTFVRKKKKKNIIYTKLGSGLNNDYQDTPCFTPKKKKKKCINKSQQDYAEKR